MNDGNVEYANVSDAYEAKLKQIEVFSENFLKNCRFFYVITYQQSGLIHPITTPGNHTVIDDGTARVTN